MTHGVSQALMHSVLQAPLLIADLPSAPQLDRSLLGGDGPNHSLNTQQKLGHLYEQALRLAIDQSDELDLVAHNVQIFDEAKQTLGELDFILHDRRSDIHVHLELAVKFYLAYRVADDWLYPGPNDRDNWPKKLARLQKHQLQLTQWPLVQSMLLERFGITSIDVRQLIYGCLFTPIADPACTARLAHMAEGARTGKWLYAREWHDHFDDQQAVFVIPKPLWPVLPDIHLKTLCHSLPSDEFLSSYRSQGAMFITKDYETTCFLAPDTWPESFLNGDRTRIED